MAAPRSLRPPLQLNGPHHVVVLVIQDMAMPQVARLGSGVEGKIAARLRAPVQQQARDMAWERHHGVLPPRVVHHGRQRILRDAAAGAAVVLLEPVASLLLVEREVEGLQVEHLELDEVDVHGMRVGREVDEFPDLGGAHEWGFGHGVRPCEVGEEGARGEVVLVRHLDHGVGSPQRVVEGDDGVGGAERLWDGGGIRVVIRVEFLHFELHDAARARRGECWIAVGVGHERGVMKDYVFPRDSCEVDNEVHSLRGGDRDRVQHLEMLEEPAIAADLHEEGSG